MKNVMGPRQELLQEKRIWVSMELCREELEERPWSRAAECLSMLGKRCKHRSSLSEVLRRNGVLLGRPTGTRKNARVVERVLARRQLIR